jgi:hypothetical protein
LHCSDPPKPSWVPQTTGPFGGCPNLLGLRTDIPYFRSAGDASTSIR